LIFPRANFEPPRHLPVPVLALKGAFFPLGFISRPPTGAHVHCRRFRKSGRRVTSVAPGGQLGSGRLCRFARVGCASFRYASLRTAYAAASSKTASERYRVLSRRGQPERKIASRLRGTPSGRSQVYERDGPRCATGFVARAMVKQHGGMCRLDCKPMPMRLTLPKAIGAAPADRTVRRWLRLLRRLPRAQGNRSALLECGDEEDRHPAGEDRIWISGKRPGPITGHRDERRTGIIRLRCKNAATGPRRALRFRKP
jgi:hypothetical protein